MTEEGIPVSLPNPSANLPTDDGIVRDARSFSSGLTLDLTDEEIAQAYRIITDVQAKYQFKRASVAVLEALRDETVTRLAAIGVLATLDPAPVLNGEPPIVEIIGKVSGDPIHDHGLDHEKKKWEVERATERKEDFLGQRGKHG